MLTIFVIDDSVTMVMSLARILKKAGYAVESSANGKEGLSKILAGFIPSLILTDLNMPEMDGVAFIKAVRKNPPTRFTPVIVLTTDAGTKKREEARAAGASGWLTKPTEPAELLAALQQFTPK